METKTRYLFDNWHIENPLAFDNISLHQIGRRYCAQTEIIDAHAHLEWFELTLVTGGAGSIITNGERAIVNRGDVYLSLPCDVHEIRADQGQTLEYDFFAFSCTKGELKKELKTLAQNCRGANNRIFQDEKIGYLLGNAITEFSQDSPHKKRLLTHVFNEIVIYVLRNFNTKRQNSAGVSATEALCWQVMNYIDTHVYSLKKVQDVAPKFNYNYSYLSTLFKATTKKNLFEYYHSRKLETARALLLENKKKVYEIAEMLHYSSPFAFSKAFAARYGISPKQLQKGARK